MHRFIATLSPVFLRRFDRYLLVNHPFVWATRIHQVLFWGLLGNLCAVLYASLIPVSSINIPSPWVGMFVLYLPVFVGLILWGRSLQERSYPYYRQSANATQSLLNMMLFGLGAFVLCAIPLVYFGILEQRLLFFLATPEFEQLGLSWGIFIFPAAWMLIESLAYFRWRHVLGAAVIGLFVFCIEVLVLLIASGGLKDGATLLLLVILQLCVLLPTAFLNDRTTPVRKAWRQISLILGSLLITILPPCLLVAVTVNFNSPFNEKLLIFWIAGLLIAASFWHFVFRKRILDIQAQPDA
ncbi:MAG: hypothetical protein AAFQ87_09735 [Bacteroidota bacterium]